MEYRYAKRYPVPGLLNCRDLGGYPLPGGQTRWGLFWRSACPCGLSEEAVAALERMGLALVIDLRSGFERRQQPSALAGRTAFALLELPLLDQIGASMTHTNDMGEFYAALLHHGQACFRTLFTRIAEVEGPVLFHCTAGKDRTGVVAALLLALAGVERPDIIADYEVSHTLIAPLIESLHGAVPGLDMNRLESRPAYMARFLDELEGLGGAYRYLTDRCSLPEATVQRLKRRLTAPSPDSWYGYRRIPLPGVENFRDLGGYPMAGGGITHWGRLYRSAFPRLGMEERQRQALLQAGVTTVLDLRSAVEDAAHPHPLAGDRRFRIVRNSPDDFLSIDPDQPFPKIYQDYLRQGADHYRAVMEAVDRADGAVLIHCFSGKDRTGMVSALLMDLAGVAAADIIADYQVSLTYLTGAEAHRIPSHAENMAAFLALLGQYGGAARFLSQRCGLPESLLERIRLRLCR